MQFTVRVLFPDDDASVLKCYLVTVPDAFDSYESDGVREPDNLAAYAAYLRFLKDGGRFEEPLEFEVSREGVVWVESRYHPNGDYTQRHNQWRHALGLVEVS